MKKISMKQFIYLFLAISLLVVFTGFGDVRIFDVRSKDYQKENAIQHHTNADEINSDHSFNFRKKVFLDEKDVQEEMLEETEVEECAKERACLRGILSFSSWKGFHNPYRIWRGRVSNLIGGQYGNASIIRFINQSDGKKKYSI